MNRLFAVCGLALLLCAWTSGAENVDGSWNVETVPAAGNKLKGTDKPYPDVLTIKGGKLSSQVAGKQGFAPGACEIKREAGKLTVSADLVSAKSGKNHYELVFTKDGMNGTMAWGKTGEDGQAKTAEFTLKEKKK